MATKKSKTTKKIAVLPDGTKLPVTGETGRYIQCGGRQFRRGNVKIETAAPEKEPEEETTENKEA
jgi:hypothetical protein